MRSKLCLTALAVVAMACSGAWEATRTVDNVLLTEWTGPYEGVRRHTADTECPPATGRILVL